MVKNFLIAAVLVIASPALVFSQDIFWSFDSTSSVITSSAVVGTSGVATIFTDGAYGFNALDLSFTTSDPSVLLLTGGTAFNDPFTTIGGTAFDSSDLTFDASGASGNLFSVNLTQNGIDPNESALFNPAWEVEVGVGGAVKLAEVTYDVVGTGTTTLDFRLGTLDFLEPPTNFVDPTLGSAELTGVVVPEPSSADLLVFCAVGMVARRRRAGA